MPRGDTIFVEHSSPPSMWEPLELDELLDFFGLDKAQASEIESHTTYDIIELFEGLQSYIINSADSLEEIQVTVDTLIAFLHAFRTDDNIFLTRILLAKAIIINSMVRSYMNETDCFDASYDATIQQPDNEIWDKLHTMLTQCIKHIFDEGAVGFKFNSSECCDIANLLPGFPVESLASELCSYVNLGHKLSNADTMAKEVLFAMIHMNNLIPFEMMLNTTEGFSTHTYEIIVLLCKFSFRDLPSMEYDNEPE